MLSLIAMLAAAFIIAAQSPVWEEVNTSSAPNVGLTLETEQQTEIIVKNGEIYIQTAKPVTVKLFSILGQLISQKELAPGLHKLRFNSKGIYILRAGTQTRRVTL